MITIANAHHFQKAFAKRFSRKRFMHTVITTSTLLTEWHCCAT